jgi:hypothetical protein
VVTGRLVDAQGLPVAGVHLARAYEDGENQTRVSFPSGGFEKIRGGSSLTGYKTDAEGRFRLDEMVPHVKFRLEAVSQKKEVIFPPDRPLEPGQRLDLGDIPIDEEKFRAEPPR